MSKLPLVRSLSVASLLAAGFISWALIGVGQSQELSDTASMTKEFNDTIAIRRALILGERSPQGKDDERVNGRTGYGVVATLDAVSG